MTQPPLQNTRAPAQTVLFVSGIRPGYRAKDLAYEFERFGRLVRCDIPAPPIRNGQPPRTCYAFIEFEQNRDAAEAYHHMHDRRIEDQVLNVQWAKNAPSSNWRFDGEQMAVVPPEGPPRGGDGGRRSRSPLPERRALDRVDQRDLGRMPPMRMENRGMMIDRGIDSRGDTRMMDREPVRMDSRGDSRMIIDREPPMRMSIDRYPPQAPQDRFQDRHMDTQRGFDRYGGGRGEPQLMASPPSRPIDRFVDGRSSAAPIGRDRYISPAHQHHMHQPSQPSHNHHPIRYDSRETGRARSRSPPPMHRSAAPPMPPRDYRDEHRYGGPDSRERDNYRDTPQQTQGNRAMPYEPRSDRPDIRGRDRDVGNTTTSTARKMVEKPVSVAATSSVVVDSNPNGWDDYRDRSKSRSPRD